MPRVIRIRRRTAATSVVAVASAGLAILGYAPDPASAAGAVSFTQVALSGTVSGSTLTATAEVRATAVTSAEYYGVCVRSAAGANYDLWKQPATISTTGTWSHPASRTLPSGTYAYFPCLQVGGTWQSVSGAAKTVTVGGSATSSTSSPTSSTQLHTTATVTQLGASSATLTWTAAAGATGYLVGRDGTDTNGSGAWSTVDAATTRSRVFNNLAAGSTYTLSVTPQPGGATSSVKVTIPTASPTTTPTSTSSTTSPTSSSTSTTSSSTSSSSTTTTPPPGVQPIGPPAAQRTLAFDDEFNGTSLDTSKWAPNWYGEGGQMNGVATYGANVKVGGGVATLTLAGATSGAAINTDPADVRGGYLLPVGGVAEARVFIPGSSTTGTVYNWPAWWASGARWALNGESDIVEGYDSGLSAENYRYGEYPNVVVSNGPHPAGAWLNGWHTYTLVRGASRVDCYWDGKLVRSVTPHDAGGGEALIVNVGDNGNTRVYGTASQVKVDYVRAWK